MDFAIVGLLLSGKTTVFAALTAGHAPVAGQREHLGVVKVPDERLARLAALVKARKVTPVEVRLHDLPPLFERGAGPSGEASETLALADALIHVVRAFQREDIAHPAGSVDPHRDIAAFDAELVLNDLGIVERRLDKIDVTVRSAPHSERAAAEAEQKLLQRVRALLSEEQPLRGRISDPQDLKGLASYSLLSLKPMLLLINIDEADAGRAEAVEEEYRARYAGPAAAVAAMCARLEAELAELPPEEAAEFRRELGGGDIPAVRVLRRTQELLGLVTFYTLGDEVRAWAVPAGTTALQAAGRVHTDIERGFVRAEVIAWDRMIELGSWAEAKKHGQARTEGKQYVVQDGDVMHVLFSI